MVSCQSGKIIVIVGLPGSGKTMLGKSLLEKDGVLLDDVSNNGGLEAIQQHINAKVAQIIVTDPHLCRSEAQRFAKTYFSQHAQDYVVEWIFFENDITACKNNLKRRFIDGDTRKVDKTLHVMSKAYHIPLEIVPQKIWRP